jgi:predicted dehydrogenase
MVIWMLGMPTRLTARKRTILAERAAGSGEKIPVGTEDHAWALLEYSSGATGTIETGRMVPGAVNDIGLEIYGTRGSLRWNQMDANYLYFADATLPRSEAGWTQIPTMQDYPGAALPPADYPVGMMRYQIASAASFLKNTLERQPYDPGLAQGVRVQRVLEAAHLAARHAEWVQIEE